MSRIVVIGGTGYAGSAIVEEATARGHEVIAFSRSAPAAPVTGVHYVQGDARDESALSSVVTGASVVVAALSPPGSFRDVYRTIARLADAERARLYVVGGFGSLRPAAGAPRFAEDLSHAPPKLAARSGEFREEIRNGAAVVIEDLPATPETLDWVFVSSAGEFGSFAPGERLGRYRIGGEVAVAPENGGTISGADYALGFVDLIEKGDKHRVQVNLAY